MTLVIEMVEAPIGVTPDESRALDGSSLSLGRSLDNDWVLRDPHRVLSKIHCLIEADGSGFRLTDRSLNGVYINGSDQALGRGRSHDLRAGDVFRLGSPTQGHFQFRVAIGADRPAAMPPAPPPAPPPGDPVVPAAARRGLPDADAGDDWLSLLAGKGEKPAQEPEQVAAHEEFILPPQVSAEPPAFAPEAEQPGHALPSDRPPAAGGPLPDNWFDDDVDETSPEPVSQPVPDTRRQPAEVPPASVPNATITPTPAPPATEIPTPVPTGADAAVAAFFKGAGIDPAAAGAMPAELELIEQAGSVFRVFVEGLRRLMLSRGSLKNEFRIEQTQIAAGNNNPIKFAPTSDEALLMLLSQHNRGYQAGVEALNEAFEDVEEHQLAVLAGMQSALISLLRRFDPGRIEARVGEAQGISRILSDPKARYWDYFCQLYDDIQGEIDDDFHKSFGRAFVEAYEQASRQRRGR